MSDVITHPCNRCGIEIESPFALYCEGCRQRTPTPKPEPARDIFDTEPTCGELSCEECNDRYAKARARIRELEVGVKTLDEEASGLLLKLHSAREQIKAKDEQIEWLRVALKSVEGRIFALSPVCHVHREGLAGIVDLVRAALSKPEPGR